MHNEQIRPMRRNSRNGGEQHAQQQNKPGGLRADRQKRRRRRRRALINVRHPDLKWKRRDFESEANQHEQHAEQKDFVVFKLRRDRREFVEVQFAGRSPNQRDAEHEKRRRQRAENQVFHARLKRRDFPALKTDEDIKRDGDEFDGNEQHHEIVGRRGKQHSRQREHDERIVFGNAGSDAVGKFHRHEQHDDGGDDEEAFEE
jgi:hypothetical protein